MEHDSPGNINHDLSLDSTKAKQQHKEIERRRRNRMKAYFEEMEQLIPNIIERNRQKKRKLDKIAILSETNEYIKELRGSHDDSKKIHGYLTDLETMKMVDLAVSAFFFVLDYDTKEIVYMSDTVAKTLGYDIEEIKNNKLGIGDFIKEKQDYDNLMDFIQNCYQPGFYMFDVTTGQFETTRFNSRAKRQMGNLMNENLENGGANTVNTSSTITPTRFRNIDLNQEITIRFNYKNEADITKCHNCYCCSDATHFLTTVSGRVCGLQEIAELNPKNSSDFYQKLWISEKINESEILTKKFFFGMARMNNEEPFSDVYDDVTGNLSSCSKIGLITIDKQFMIGSIDDDILEKYGINFGELNYNDNGNLGIHAQNVISDESIQVIKNRIDSKTENFVVFCEINNYSVNCSVELILNAYDNEFEVAIVKVPL